MVDVGIGGVMSRGLCGGMCGRLDGGRGGRGMRHSDGEIGGGMDGGMRELLYGRLNKWMDKESR